jgi:uncharacterized protein YggL (DUF469 family)
MHTNPLIYITHTNISISRLTIITIQTISIRLQKKIHLYPFKYLIKTFPLKVKNNKNKVVRIKAKFIPLESKKNDLKKRGGKVPT